MRSPTARSCAEIDATCAISCRSSISRASSSSLAATAHGLVDATLECRLRPTSRCAGPRGPSLGENRGGRVPSPATSLVLVATSWPAGTEVLVRVLELNLLGDRDAVVRDRGCAPLLVDDDVAATRPSVTFTASAGPVTPRSSARRAESSNCRVFAMCVDVLSLRGNLARPPGRVNVATSGEAGFCPGEAEPCLLAMPGCAFRRSLYYYFDDREHVAGGQHEARCCT